MNLSTVILVALVSALIAYRIGYKDAHFTVAKECKTLGGFYVAGETFKCSLVEPKESGK